MDLEKSWRNDGRPFCERFVNSASHEKNAADRQQCDRLSRRPCRFVNRGRTISAKRLTTGFAAVEAKQDADDTGDHQYETEEIEIINVFFQSSPLMWVEVQEKEKDRGRDCPRREVDPKAPTGTQYRKCSESVNATYHRHET